MKKILCVLLVILLCLTAAPLGGFADLNFNLKASAACVGGCSFTAQKIGTKYLKSESTCGKQAVYYYSCDICGESSQGTSSERTFKYGTAPSHNWGPVQTVPATCTEPETKVQTCTRCGEKYAKKGTGTGTGHTEKYVSNGDGTHTKICTKVNCTLHEVSDCSSAVTICGQVPLCDYCNTLYGKTEGHDLAVAEIKKQPTCTEKGEALKKCSRCTYTVTEEIDELGHDILILSVIKNATCLEDGLESVICKRCTFAGERVVLAKGHDYKKTNFPVSCAADGYDLYQCKNCDHQYKDNWVTDRQHNYIEDRVEATCTTSGIITYTCGTCGISKDSVIIPAYGHDMTGYVVTKEASCTAEGLMTDKCKRCSRTVTETIPTLGHDLDIVVISATCTEDGFTENICRRCNYSSKYNYISALGHDKKITNAIQPTCVYEGWNEFSCSRCGIEERERIDPLGHEYTYTSDGNATCTQDGTRTGKCIRCPQKITDTDPGSALGHSYTHYILNNNATCTANATEWAVCDHGCGTKDIREIVDSAFGHNYEWINITADGYNVFCCENCGHTYTENNGEDEHYYPENWTTIIAPTCKEKGVAIRICYDCNNIESKYLTKTGHIDNDGDTYCDFCDYIIQVVKPEEKPCDCNCHAGGLKAFFFKLTNLFAKIFSKAARTCACGKSH